MACRYAVLSVALTVCLVAESRAQEKATPDATKPAPNAVQSATSDGAAADAPAATSDAKTTTTKSARSRADNKSASSKDTRTKPKSEQATFGGGCFWHVEADFEKLKGVNWAVSGYAGGNVPYPSYEMVHEGFTGHAEVVMIDYDPEVISYEDLLNVFWKIHDPTSINRQGPDEGPQYRSIILYHNEDQRRAALASYRALTAMGAYRSPIVTQLVPLKAFYRAEDYHQDYYGGKPRTSTRRKSTSAKVKKSSASKSKNSRPAAKPADRNASEPAAKKAPSAQLEGF